LGKESTGTTSELRETAKPVLPPVLSSHIPDEATFSGKDIKQCLSAVKHFLQGENPPKKPKIIKPLSKEQWKTK